MITPTIAILIPCYNAAKYLPNLFQAIAAQTIPFDEIICYDDGSTDDTVAVASNFGAKVIKGDKNRGAAFGRNRLIEAANSKWVHFHDADDLITDDFVEKMRSLIEKLPEYEANTAILSNMKVQNGHGYETTVIYDQKEIEKDAVAYFLDNSGFAIIGCYPKLLLKKINGFREDLRGNEDPDLHIRLAFAKAKFICSNEALVTNITHDDSFSATNWLTCWEDKLKCLHYYYENFDRKYHLIIGEHAALLSNNFFKIKKFDKSDDALQLAQKTGVRKIGGTTFAKVVSGIFGLSFYIWIYRKRMQNK
jgi:glycosyltransferase involved in cell wall biosynthesis